MKYRPEEKEREDVIAAEERERALPAEEAPAPLPEEDKDKDKNKDKTGSLPEKFKNPEELMRAYRELEREFTRRSQRLAEAEKRLREAEAPFAPTREEWKETVDKFFEKNPAAKPFAGEMAREMMKDPALRAGRNCLGDALVRVLISAHRTPEQLMSDGQFLKEYVLSSPVVKAAVVDGYLKGLRKGQPPAVMRDGGQFGVTPRRSPKSIEEAGELFLKDAATERSASAIIK